MGEKIECCYNCKFSETVEHNHTPEKTLFCKVHKRPVISYDYCDSFECDF